jgi:uncharacterized membrane protein YccC
LPRDPSATDDDVLRRLAVVASLSEFFAVLAAFAEAYEGFASPRPANPSKIGVLSISSDPLSAFWTGLRAAVAVLVVSGFWILTAWPHGSTTTILTSVATSRLATMGHAVPIAIMGSLIFSAATVPALIVVDMLLPLATGFDMFALVVAPVLFACALLMAHKRTYLIGFFSALLFSAVGDFQDHMTYDAVALLNTAIAAVMSAGVAFVLWAILAPDTAEAARSRFARVARRALASISAPELRIGLREFETKMTDALAQLQGYMRSDVPEDIACIEGGIAVLNAGRELLRLRDERLFSETRGLRRDIAQSGEGPRVEWLGRARTRVRLVAAWRLTELRERVLGAAQVETSAPQAAAFAAIEDELQQGSALLRRPRIMEVVDAG